MHAVRPTRPHGDAVVVVIAYNTARCNMCARVHKSCVSNLGFLTFKKKKKTLPPTITRPAPYEAPCPINGINKNTQPVHNTNIVAGLRSFRTLGLRLPRFCRGRREEKNIYVRNKTLLSSVSRFLVFAEKCCIG